MAYIKERPQMPLFDTKLTRGEKADALKFLAALYLSKRGYHPAFEVSFENTGRRADVLAVNYGLTVAIVEVKSSISDFCSDEKWPEYLKTCDKFYFCSDERTIEHIAQTIKGSKHEKRIGLISCNLEHMTSRLLKPSREDYSHKISDFDLKRILYQSILASDVFIGGTYQGKWKPIYRYVGCPYEHVKAC